jgi:deoxyribose-phosphate aldolase
VSDPTRFLNVDLDLEGDEDLAPLVAAFEGAAFSLHDEAGDGTFRATLELSADPSNALTGIRGFIAAVEALPASARAIWDRLGSRRLDVGVQAGGGAAFRAELPASMLAQLARLGLSLAITIYAAVGKEHPDAPLGQT